MNFTLGELKTQVFASNNDLLKPILTKCFAEIQKIMSKFDRDFLRQLILQLEIKKNSHDEEKIDKDKKDEIINLLLDKYKSREDMVQTPIKEGANAIFQKLPELLAEMTTIVLNSNIAPNHEQQIIPAELGELQTIAMVLKQTLITGVLKAAASSKQEQLNSLKDSAEFELQKNQQLFIRPVFFAILQSIMEVTASLESSYPNAATFNQALKLFELFDGVSSFQGVLSEGDKDAIFGEFTKKLAQERNGIGVAGIALNDFGS